MRLDGRVERPVDDAAALDALLADNPSVPPELLVNAHLAEGEGGSGAAMGVRGRAEWRQELTSHLDRQIEVARAAAAESDAIRADQEAKFLSAMKSIGQAAAAKEAAQKRAKTAHALEHPKPVPGWG